MRLIDADAMREEWLENGENEYVYDTNAFLDSIDAQPTIEAVPVVHGEWLLEAHNEKVNYRWNVTAECSECGESKGEIWAGFFPGVPNSLADAVAIDCAERVKISNFCPACGADMRKEQR